MSTGLLAQRPGALLLDLDGTLYVGDDPLPGAVEAIRLLQRREIPRRYLTNSTRRSRRALAERLRGMGFPVEEQELFTAGVAAAEWLRREGVRRVALYLPEPAHEDFAGLEVVESGADAVVVGDLGEEWSFGRLNAAFRELLHGARLVALQKNRFWQTPEGLVMDAGPFVAALEHASGRGATVVGKPSPEFFALAARSLSAEPHDVAMVGDDVEVDVAGAQAAGIRGVLVRTGKFREEVLSRSEVHPDLVVNSLAEVIHGWFA